MALDQRQIEDIIHGVVTSLRAVSNSSSMFSTAMNTAAGKLSKGVSGITGAFDELSNSLGRSFKNGVKDVERQTSEEERIRRTANRHLEDTISDQSALFSKRKQHEQEDLINTMRARQRAMLDGAEYQKRLDDQHQKAVQQAKRRADDKDASDARLAALEKKRDAMLQETVSASGEKEFQEKVDKLNAAVEREEKINKRIASDGEALARTIKKIDKASADTATKMASYAAEMENERKRLADIKLDAKIEAGINKTFEAVLTGAKALAAKAFYDTIKTYRTEMKTQGSIGDVSQVDTAMLGMSRPEYAQLMAEYRRAALSMGGLTQTTDALNETNEEFFKLTGDLKESTEVRMQMFDTMAKAGIKGSAKQLRDFSANFADISTRSGISLKQFADATKDLMEQEETQTALRMAASESEREQILMNTQERLKEYTAMGMTVNQAKAAASAMNALAGKGPKERFKTGIKMQAMMGAMGVGGGEDVARIMRKPKNKWTKEDERIMAGATTGLSNAMSERMGGDNLGAAMQTEAMGEKMGITEDSLKNFNTNAIKPLADEINKNTEELAKQNKGGMVDQIMRGGIMFWDIGKSILWNTPWIGALLGGMALVATRFTFVGKLVSGVASRLTGVLGGAAGKLSGLFGGGATAGTGGVASAAGGKVADAAGGAMSSIGKGIKDIGKGAGNAIASIFGGLSNGLKALSNPRLFIGVGVLAALGGSLWVAGKALTAFTEIKWQDAATGVATVAGLAVVASALGGAAAPMLIGAGAIAALGGAMWIAGNAAQQFAKAFQMFAEVDWTSLGSGLEQFGLGLGAMVTAAPNPLSLGVLAASLGVFGLSLMPVAASVALMDTDKLSTLTDNMNKMAEVDINKLNKVADVMERIANANSPSIGSTIASAATNMWNTITGQKSPDEGKEKNDGKDNESNNPALDTIRMQLAAMNSSNKYLERVANGTDVMVELANKQLVAMTLTDKEKEKNRDRVRRGSGFSGAANYEYV